MQLVANVKIENMFKAKDFTDKKSGEVKIGKWKIQTFDNIETEQGTQMKLVDISIPDELAEKLKNKVGETVSIPVGTFINNNRVGLYGLGL